MKKTFCFLLCAVMMFSLCACIDNSPPPGYENTTSASKSGELSGNTPESSPPEESSPVTPGNTASGNGTNPSGTDSTSSGNHSALSGNGANSSGNTSGTSGNGADTSGGESADALENQSAEPQSMDICLSGEPETLDPARVSTLDALTMTAHLFSGLAKWDCAENGSIYVVPDAAESLPDGVMNEDGSITYTYTLRNGLTWSDGQPLRAQDFVFAWNRAASAELSGYYAYLFSAVAGFDEMRRIYPDGSRVNPEAHLGVEAPDEKTLRVTLPEPLFGWNQLLAFPAFFPVREDVVENASWASGADTYVSCGAYTLTEWEHDTLIAMEKNSAYPEAASVSMDTLRFHLSDNDGEVFDHFAAGEWQFADRVPAYTAETLRERWPDELHVTGQLGTYYVCWNVNAEILPGSSTLSGADAERARAEIRRAVSLLIDRNYITDSIAQGGQVPASSLVPMGMTNADGSQFYQTAGNRSDYSGYYNVSPDAIGTNYDTALEILSRYYTFDETEQGFADFPVLTYLYNANEGHRAIAEYIQSALAGVEIPVRKENPELGEFLTARKNGAFTLARNGYLADFDDPLLFLEMWTSDAEENVVRFGQDAHASVYAYSMDLTPYGYENRVENGSWADTYDVLIRFIRECTDGETRTALLHEAEDLLMSTGCIMPLYFYTDLYLAHDTLNGVYVNPMGMKYFTRCRIS